MKRRRGAGEGLIRLRSDNRWEGRVDLGWQNGKRIRKCLYAATRVELQTRMRELLRGRDRGTGPSSSASPTLARFLTGWLATIKRSVRVRSYERYEGIVTRHIVPDLGRVRLEKLNPSEVRSLLAAKTAAGLGARTVGQIRLVLAAALDQAVREDAVPRNVAALVDSPKVPHSEMKVLTPPQASALLQAAKAGRLEALYWIALTTGLRRGELLALKWEDIELERGTLSVKRSLGRANGGIVIDAPKTAQGRRTVRLCEPAIARLRAHHKRQLEARLMNGPDWRDEGWVFTTGIGTTLDPRNLGIDFRHLLTKAELPRIRFHDLRHSAATIALSENIHPKVVSEMLGHSKISVTLDLYTHSLPNLQAEAAEKIGAALTFKAVTAS
jgi:integrase